MAACQVLPPAVFNWGCCMEQLSPAACRLKTAAQPHSQRSASKSSLCAEKQDGQPVWQVMGQNIPCPQSDYCWPTL